MIRRIVLENFMSHASTAIELADGLTVLVGPNNCGKSAVVEALRAVCNSAQGSYMVRHGEKEARVTIETDDGHRIVWKRKNSPSYEIDGQPYDRLKGNIPEKLHEYLRMACVETSQGNRFDVHFGLQKTPIFLLDETAGSKTADFFSSASDAEKLMRMQQLHRETVRNARERKKELEKELEFANRQMQTLEPITPLAADVQAMEAEHESLTWDMGVARELAGAIGRIEELEIAVRHRTAERESAESLKSSPVLEETAALEKMVGGLDRAALSKRIHGDRAGALLGMREAPAAEDVDALEKLIKMIESLAGKRICISEAVEVLGGVREAPAEADVLSLLRLIDQFAENRRRSTQLALEVVEAGRKVAELEEQIQSWAAANPVCPVCGETTDPARILEAAHRHA